MALVALTRFKRTLKRARLSVRELTHTLHLPPALSEIYGGPKPTWLRDVLEYLPNLQSLLVSRLPFFDHPSLVALRHASNPKEHPGGERYFPLYGLRLLLAAKEPNTTSIGIAEALSHFPGLVYLDLSFTTPARDPSVLRHLGVLADLQVLKLRGVGLKDLEAEILANAIGLRVRLLDLRDNQLTDSAVRSLLQACFLPPDNKPNPARTNSRAVEDWPLGLPPGPDFLSLDTLRSEDLDQQLLKQLTRPLTGRLAFEDIPHKGLTHLYIADNQLTVEGLAGLLKSTRLHVLDGGTVDTARSLTRSRTVSSPTSHREPIHFPGTEKLIPLLGTVVGNNLTYLRLNHAIVTENASTKESSSPILSPTTPAHEPPRGESRIELDGVEAEISRVELDASEPIFELSAEPPEPRFELPGDCIHFALSPAVNKEPVQEPEEPFQSPIVRGEGAFAPEVVPNGDTPNGGVADDYSSDEEVVLNAMGTGYTTRKKPPRSNGRSRTISDNGSRSGSVPSPPLPPPHQPSFSAPRNALIEKLMLKRPSPNTPPASPQSPTSSSLAYLHPSHLPHLRTLVLTDVPTHVPASSAVVPGLIRFISACADEVLLSCLRAQTNYSLPPGRSRIAAEHAHARTLFALGTLVLEMAPPAPKIKPGQQPALTPWTHSRQRVSWSKSSTGDMDSENLWSAAENDFSFFGEDECGIPENEPEKYFPSALMNEKVYLGPDDERSQTPGTPDSMSSIHRQGTLHGGGSGDLHTLGPPGTPTMIHSPRNLPLGRQHRSSFETSERPRSIPGRHISLHGHRHELYSPDTNPLPNNRPRSINNDSPSPKPELSHVQEPTVDVVAELAKFRRGKKAEYENALLQWRIRNNPHNPYNNTNTVNGNSNGKARAAAHDDLDQPERSLITGGIGGVFVEGHWKGEVKIVRNAAPKGRSGVVDMYGNYFEKGYLYP